MQNKLVKYKPISGFVELEFSAKDSVIEVKIFRVRKKTTRRYKLPYTVSRLERLIKLAQRISGLEKPVSDLCSKYQTGQENGFTVHYCWGIFNSK